MIFRNILIFLIITYYFIHSFFRIEVRIIDFLNIFDPNEIKLEAEGFKNSYFFPNFRTSILRTKMLKQSNLVEEISVNNLGLIDKVIFVKIAKPYFMEDCGKFSFFNYFGENIGTSVFSQDLHSVKSFSCDLTTQEAKVMSSIIERFEVISIEKSEFEILIQLTDKTILTTREFLNDSFIKKVEKLNEINLKQHSNYTIYDMRFNNPVLR